MRTVLVGLLLTAGALSADWSSLYDAKELESQRPHLTNDINQVVAQEVQPFLTDSQALAFSKIQIDFPIMADPSPNPFDFFSVHEGRIILPLLTVQFIEDMSEAYSWLWANRYSSLTVDEYLGMLGNRVPGDFPGSRYPAPLVALHIPSNGMENSVVANMAKRVRATTFAFIILHEFGHLSYRTAAAQSIGKRDKIAGDEEIADAFALDIMKKNSEPPAGLLMLIHGLLYLPSVPPKDHPVTVQRLRAMADFLDGKVREFVEGRPDRRLAFIAIESLANHIRRSAGFLSDTTGQRLWSEDSSKRTVSDLAPRRVGEEPTPHKGPA